MYYNHHYHANYRLGKGSTSAAGSSVISKIHVRQTGFSVMGTRVDD